MSDRVPILSDQLAGKDWNPIPQRVSNSMPNLLSDPPTWLYGLLVLLVVVPLLAAFFFPENRPQSRDSQKKTAVRRKWFFIIAGLGLLLLIGLALCDYFFESDREQIKRKLNEMSEDVRNRNL